MALRGRVTSGLLLAKDNYYTHIKEQCSGRATVVTNSSLCAGHGGV